ncbi:uncharacterized protein BYT42DRAFT_489202 [Radiomyces spectabilis]|uniref:uncharacterized protein n=1 Tax=Radiomyces spectabilis TaxID=64574 RepID=UPI00221F686B|nr:uncharacterized protein BYT42DRAFT_489202 [Radiomyces spectabilis]KAI8391798.1 hypothetical protein BYT42DRAFT_489202 [Radiomyces spectabilis]
MKLSTAALINCALFGLVTAQQAIVSITSPLAGTKYKAGQDAIISWINPTTSTISQIVLAKGPSTALQPVMTIAQNVNAADGSYTWKIPMDIENSEEYAFELGTSPDLAFAGHFTIEGGVGASSGSSSSNNSSAAAQPTNGTHTGTSASSAPSGASASLAPSASGNLAPSPASSPAVTPAAPPATPAASNDNKPTNAASPRSSSVTSPSSSDSTQNVPMVAKVVLAMGVSLVARSYL